MNIGLKQAWDNLAVALGVNTMKHNGRNWIEYIFYVGCGVGIEAVKRKLGTIGLTGTEGEMIENLKKEAGGLADSLNEALKARRN